MLVEYREYLNNLILEQEIHAVWKAAQEHTTGSSMLHGVCLRTRSRTFYGGIEFQDELNAKTRLLIFIPTRRFLRVSGRGWLDS